MSRPTEIKPNAATAGPSTLWLGIGALLAGVGTVLLGPILPDVSHRWNLSDANSGWLIFAKFIGAFLGGVSIPRKLRYGILWGTLLSCIGFALFGMASGLISGCPALFVAGIGLGQLIASTNILAGNRYPEHTGSALASLNFFWSFGAVGTGVLVAAFLPRLGLRNLLFWIGAPFLVTAIGGRLRRRRDTSTVCVGIKSISKLPRTVFLQFACLLFLYGGLETCLTAWLTTYTLRYTTDVHLLGGQSGTVLLWAALTAGRAVASLALRFINEQVIQRISLVLSLLFIIGLATARGTAALSVWCILLGISLAPFFPATFGLLLRRSPPAREAGFILAVSGLGAAVFPKLMGSISTYTGSLRAAMAVPAVLTLCLLITGTLRMREAAPAPYPEAA